MTSKEAIEKIKHLLFGSETFGMLKTKDGVEMKVEGDVELEKTIYIVTPDGEMPAADGDYEMEDEMVIKVKEGMIDRIDYKKVEEEVMEEHDDEESMKDDEEKLEDVVEEKIDEEVKMVTAELIDGTIVESDTEELKEGDALFVVTEEGRVEVPDAVHETSDGKLVTTLDGIVVKIEEKVEVEVEEELNFSELLETFTQGFNHLTNELNVLRENYDTLQENFNKFSAEPAGERLYNNRSEFIKARKEQQFSKLEALAALKNKNK